MASTITPDELRERVALLPFVQEFLRQLEAPTGDADAAILVRPLTIVIISFSRAHPGSQLDIVTVSPAR